jgi:hypothetical protein
VTNDVFVVTVFVTEQWEAPTSLGNIIKISPSTLFRLSVSGEPSLSLSCCLISVFNILSQTLHYISRHFLRFFLFVFFFAYTTSFNRPTSLIYFVFLYCWLAFPSSLLCQFSCVSPCWFTLLNFVFVLSPAFLKLLFMQFSSYTLFMH